MGNCIESKREGSAGVRQRADAFGMLAGPGGPAVVDPAGSRAALAALAPRVSRNRAGTARRPDAPPRTCGTFPAGVPAPPAPDSRGSATGRLQRRRLETPDHEFDERLARPGGNNKIPL